MDLTVAIGVEEHSVLYAVSATFGTPDDVMVVPPCELGDFLATDRTDTPGWLTNLSFDNDGPFGLGAGGFAA